MEEDSENLVLDQTDAKIVENKTFRNHIGKDKEPIGVGINEYIYIYINFYLMVKYCYMQG